MTNLSEQICKVCGIEPVYVYYVKIFKSNNYYQNVGVSREYVESFFRDFSECKPRVFKVEKRLPDLKQPNNFVKLIELRISKSVSLGNYVRYKSDICRSWHNRETFLELLRDLLTNTESKRVSIIKQAIRQEQWEV